MTAFGIEETARTLEDGRLFPLIDIGGGWHISAQADGHGYGCAPRARLPRLSAYERVEVLLVGPLPIVDPHNLDLPAGLSGHFPPLEEQSPAIARDFPVALLPRLCDAILTAAMRNPNAGVPPGRFGWAGATVHHGTGGAAAESIAEHGISMSASGGGYYGRAFYVADDKELAQGNYAGFADDEAGGAVLSFTVSDDARILDQRNSADAAAWAQSGLSTADPDLPAKATALGIDGIYDRAVGGIAVFNPAALQFEALELCQEAPAGLEP